MAVEADIAVTTIVVQAIRQMAVNAAFRSTYDSSAIHSTGADMQNSEDLSLLATPGHACSRMPFSHLLHPLFLQDRFSLLSSPPPIGAQRPTTTKACLVRPTKTKHTRGLHMRRSCCRRAHALHCANTFSLCPLCTFAEVPPSAALTSEPVCHDSPL